MEDLLTHAYFRLHCHQCGGSYTLSLYDILQQYRLGEQWTNLHDHDDRDVDTELVMNAIPRAALEDAERAWLRIIEASQAAGLELLVTGRAAEGQHPHQH